VLRANFARLGFILSRTLVIGVTSAVLVFSPQQTAPSRANSALLGFCKKTKAKTAAFCLSAILL
jgi:hypothetical protein